MRYYFCRSSKSGHGKLCPSVKSGMGCREEVRGQGIILDRQERRERIWELAQEAARQANGTIPEQARADLLEEVTDLVEAPTVILGRFDSAFLELPE